MPSDVTPERYGTLLQAAIKDYRPVQQILSEVTPANPGTEPYRSRAAGVPLVNQDQMWSFRQ